MSLRIISRGEELQEGLKTLRSQGHSVGLVPTMGALHQGHLSLVAEARRRAEIVVVTIFVNPTQFSADEDLDEYPRPLEEDLRVLREAGVDIVFTPRREEMYPKGESTRVKVSGLTGGLCGRSRPEHFEGVTTIVAKLFHLAGECVAIFGKKDYQQWRVIERMARDLFFPVQVVGAPIIRETDGLALSSRNTYLSSEERARAVALPQALLEAQRLFENGERRQAILRRCVRERLENAGFEIDYIEFRDPEELFELGQVLPESTLLAVAAVLGQPRLIDNILLGSELE